MSIQILCGVKNYFQKNLNIERMRYQHLKHRENEISTS